ncbi:hypothetical protein NC653_037332 [Populus alba x Populus x berolinensis]|uniref:Uncharacterized protein n=1 Tax=Populus alba x Populus x berolinensis TaxID=444605 RepID=A0AAD6LE98_9ROSI|nr:hypothetical protein NC653_037332 [Populus alba x Populus x berolinensis]
MHYSCIQPVLELIGTHAKDITLSAPEPDDPQDAVVAQQVQFVAIVCHCILETTRPLLAQLATGQKLFCEDLIAWGRGKGKDVNSLFTFLSNPTIFSFKDLTLETKLVKIMDWREKMLGNKRVSLARVLWRNLCKKEEMWERESEIMEEYHFLEDK